MFKFINKIYVLNIILAAVMFALLPLNPIAPLISAAKNQLASILAPRVTLVVPQGALTSTLTAISSTPLPAGSGSLSSSSSVTYSNYRPTQILIRETTSDKNMAQMQRDL